VRVLHKSLRWSASLLGILILAMLINTLQLETRQPAAGTPATISIDADAAAERLAHLVRLRTLASDTNPEPFHKLADTLTRQWPSVYQSLTRVHVNAHSQVLVWPGRNDALPPLLLLAHLDVVPADAQRWQQPPFDGAIVDNEIWGRGTLDDKGSAAAILEAIAALQQTGFTPRRTLIVAFGYDEETGGERGAKAVAAWLEHEQITPWLVLDEGGFVLENSPLPTDAPVALVGVAEKGYLSVEVSAFALSGHSSMPPRDLAIFRLARALQRIEANPFPMSLDGPSGATFAWLAPDMRWPEKVLFANRWAFEPLIVSQLARTPSGAALLHTTQAPTLLSAGIKDNVLPETASATINFRVHPRDNADAILEHLRQSIDDPAIELTPLNAFSHASLQPSDWHSPVFARLATVIRSSFPDAQVAPYQMVAATDARHFRALTDQVYRFLPFRLDNSELSRLHGRDERISIASYVEAVNFYATLIMQSSADD